jgi:hypothetical protein
MLESGSYFKWFKGVRIGVLLGVVEWEIEGLVAWLLDSVISILACLIIAYGELNFVFIFADFLLLTSFCIF